MFSFNSLQTGNCIQTKLSREQLHALTWAVSIPFKRETAFKLNGVVRNMKEDYGLSFNSLQTGNCIQTTVNLLHNQTLTLVSIPFKRETAFKLGDWKV